MRKKYLTTLGKTAMLCAFSVFLATSNPIDMHAQVYRDFTGLYNALESDMDYNTALMHTITAEPDENGEYTGIVGYGYKLTSVENSYYSLVFQNRSVNAPVTYSIIKVVNGVEEKVSSVDVSMGARQVQNISVSANQTYYVLAYTDNKQNVSGDSYITINAAVDDCGDSPESAKTMNVSETLNGTLDGKGDVDYIKFTAPETNSDLGSIVAVTFANDTVGCGAEFHLFDNNLKELSGTAATLTQGKQKKGTLSLSSGKTYYISVTAANSTAAVQNGKYHISLAQVADDVSDGMTGANNVSIGSKDTGVIQSSTDIDMFKVNTGNLKGFQVVFYNNGSDSSALYCNVLRGSGKLIKSVRVTGSNNKTMDITGLDKNTNYYVKVSGTSGAAYSFKVDELDYKIKYHVNGGENAESNPHSYVYGVGAAISEPTRENYEFLGWYKNSSFVGSKVTKISDTKYGDVTLYARWKKSSALDLSNIRASKITDTSVTLKWSNNLRCTGFEIYQGDKKIGTTKRFKTSYKVTGLSAGKQYSFKVRTYKKKGDDITYGNFITLKQYTALPAVNITYTKGDSVSWSKGQISLSWDKIQKANVGYEVYISSTKYGPWKKKILTSSDVTSYTIKNIYKKAYWVKVRGVMKTSKGKTVYGAYSTPTKVYAKTQK